MKKLAMLVLLAACGGDDSGQNDSGPKDTGTPDNTVQDAGSTDSGLNFGDVTLSLDTGTTSPIPTTCAEAILRNSYIGCDYWPTVTLNPVYSQFDYAVDTSFSAAAKATYDTALARDGQAAAALVKARFAARGITF